VEKTKKLVVFAILIFVVSGCLNPKPKISEDQARTIVIKQHSGNIGKVEIISVNHENGEYKIKWDNKENCESGTDYLDDENGEIKKGEASKC
jgi:uncharacterized membrane protein YkoI